MEARIFKLLVKQPVFVFKIWFHLDTPRVYYVYVFVNVFASVCVCTFIPRVNLISHKQIDNKLKSCDLFIH